MLKLSEPETLVREAILAHYTRTPTPVTQRIIATETGLTVPRVREALNTLSREGLIEWKPNCPNSIRIRQAKTVQGDSRTLSALRMTSQALAVVHRMILRLERQHKIPIELDDSKKLSNAYDVMVRARQLLVLNGVEVN